MPPHEETKNKEISVNTSQETLKGTYSNAVKVAVTDYEVMIDFAFIYPGNVNQNEGVLTNRIIINHDLATKLSTSINETLKSHINKKTSKNGKSIHNTK